MYFSKSFRASIFVSAAVFFLTAKGLPGDNESGSFHMRNAEPVMVEATKLAPGGYVWTRMQSLANHNIVQISDDKTHRVVVTILAISSYRAVATSENVLDFWETPKGAPVAVRAWYSPGENYGQEFPYVAQPAILLPNLVLDSLTEPAAAPLEEPLPQSASKPRASSKKIQVRRTGSEGSWAVISDGAADASLRTIPAKPKQPGTIWDALSKLPLTATLAPLIGIIGIVSLVLFLLSYLKRKRQQNFDDSAV